MELKRSSKDVKEAKNICIQKFIRAFPKGFYDENYLSWERDYKSLAHERWQQVLSKKEFKKLMTDREYEEVAMRALSVESRTNLLLPYEKMALRDAIKNADGAEMFAKGLYQLLFGTTTIKKRFSIWCEMFDGLPGIRAVEASPRNKDKVLSWPVYTVFGFLAEPNEYVFLKADEMHSAAASYGFHLKLDMKLRAQSYTSFLEFCEEVKTDLRKLKPRDMIDIQSFLWVVGSAEY